MIFSLILFVLLAAVAFFHYIQGFFSATISAILIVFATIVAVAYHEQVARLLVNSGKMPEQAAAIALAVLFALTYLVPKIIFDKVVPGNVRFWPGLDKAGAAVMGLIAGLLSTGIVGLAAGALPFGPSVGGYSRLNLSDQQGVYSKAGGAGVDIEVHDFVTQPNLDPDNENHLWFHQDDLVIGLLNKVSGGGSLGGDVPFAAVHPDYPGELFGQRLGIQVGEKHTIVNTDTSTPLKVEGVWTQPSFTQVDGEIGFYPALSSIRQQGDQALEKVLVPGDGKTLLIVRVDVDGAKEVGDDGDSLLRFGVGNVRLVAGHMNGSTPEYKDYYPVAILDPRRIAVAEHLDDFLLADMKAEGGHKIDFIFVVDNDHAIDGDAGKPPFKLPDGTFFEMKRYAQVDLSGTSVDEGPPRNTDPAPIVRKPEEVTAIDAAQPIPAVMPNSAGSSAPPVASGGGRPAAPAGRQASGGQSSGGQPAGGQPAGGQPAAASGFLGLKYVGADSSDKLFSGIDVNNGDPNGSVAMDIGVTGQFAQRKWVKLTVAEKSSLKDLASPGDETVDTFTVPDGDSMVQVHLTAPLSGTPEEMWAWGEHLSDFQIVDATGKAYPCVGAEARVKQPDDYMVANFSTYGPDDRLAAIPQGKGRPTDIYLNFQVPQAAVISSLQYQGKDVAAINLKAK
jgi:hypothetical protein